MELLDAISERRSIRIFKKDPVPRELIEKLVEAAVLSPSIHNKQLWRFVVIENEKKNELVKILEARVKTLSEQGVNVGTYKRTVGCIRRSNAIIFVFNDSSTYEEGHEKPEAYMWVTEVLSIGAAMQNMLLRAHELGLGALWICDTFYAYEEISEWLGRKDEFMGGICLGYADESPSARPRRPWNEVTEWLK